MTEEKVEITPEVKPEVTPTVKPETPDKVTELAMKLGWNPDHEGGDRPFKSAEEYILMSREIQDTTSKQLRAQRRETDDLKAGLDALKDHNEKVYKVHVKNLKKELRGLKKQRGEAEEDGDTGLVRQIDKEIKEIEDTPDEVSVKDTKRSPTFKKWLEKNDWYNTDEEMQIYADAQSYDKELVGLPEEKVYAAIRKRTKKQFPERFEQVKTETEPKPKAPSVESSTPPKKEKSKFTMKDLNEDQKKYAKTFADQGIMKVEDYINELVEIGELK